MFEPIELEWKDLKVKILAENVMRAIATVEDNVTLFELHDMFAKGAPKITKLVMAYASLLRFAGVPVTDEEVMTDAFREAGMQKLMLSLSALLQMMQPKEEIKTNTADAGNVKKKAVARISRKRTNSR